MNTAWYVVKVLPGKERSLTEQFNKDIGMNRISNIMRFICPTEKEFVVVKNKKVIREKVLYSGYLYFEAPKQLEEDDLKIISLIPNIFSIFLIELGGLSISSSGSIIVFKSPFASMIKP
jgi:transcription antitermination factor NusG